MPYKITGRTFEYRDKLRDYGAKWDGDAKLWTLFAPTDWQLKEMRSWLGVTVTGDAPRENATKPNAFDALMAALDTEELPSLRDIGASSAFYGDDPKFHGRFAIPNPCAFFGFSSISAMIDYIRAIPTNVSTDRRRNDGWTGNPGWTGSNDMSHAIEIARDGLPGKHIDDVITQISAQHATKPSHRYSATGGAVSVPRLLAGNPMAMRRRERVKGQQRITLFVDCTISSEISARASLIRAIAVAGMVDVIEREGYSCEIIAIDMTAARGPQTAVTLKNAGERLSINDIIFGLGHPSFIRRFVFACNASANEAAPFWKTMGAIAEAFTEKHRPGKNEFYIKPMTAAVQRCITGRTLAEQALSIIPYIQPVNLPIKVINDAHQHD